MAVAVAAVFVVVPVVVVVVGFVVEEVDVASPAGCVLEPSPTNDNGEEDLSEDREERASSDLSSARLLNAVAVAAPAAPAAAAVVVAAADVAVLPPKYPPSPPPPAPVPAPAAAPAPVPPTPLALDEYPPLVAGRTRPDEYCCMRPLKDGRDRSLASFSLAGGTWDPISSVQPSISLVRAQSAFFDPSARPIYAHWCRWVRWSSGACRGGRGRCTTLLDIQVNSNL